MIRIASGTENIFFAWIRFCVQTEFAIPKNSIVFGFQRL